MKLDLSMLRWPFINEAALIYGRNPLTGGAARPLESPTLRPLVWLIDKSHAQRKPVEFEPPADPVVAREWALAALYFAQRLEIGGKEILGAHEAAMALVDVAVALEVHAQSLGTVFQGESG